jgi:pimeloyl-ACP methyl ester carboxylesterase
MKTKILQKTVLSLTALALVGIAPVRTATAQQPGPLDISGEINGAPFRIVVPAYWNGTLLLFQRGYTDKHDHPEEPPDNRNPTIAPAAVRDALLANGYALSGSARKANGWSVEEGLDDVVALASYFRENVANPTITILWGASMGSVITLETAERNGGLFNGYLAVASVGAGAPRTWDQGLVLRLAYDVTFGMPTSWGTPGDVRDDLDFEPEVLPILSAQAGDPENFGRFEFIRLVAGFPGSGIAPPPGYYPGALIGLVFFLATEGEAELERRAGGPIAQNITHTYALTPDERVYLASLGVDADPLLEAMNARRNIAALPEPRNYVEHFADYSGLIKHPVLTLHTAVDEVVVVASGSAYRDTVAAVGRDDLLVQVYTTGIGHGSFTTDQYFAAIRAVEEWARSGTPPPSSAFPAELGFIPGYVPPAWPQP